MENERHELNVTNLLRIIEDIFQKYNKRKDIFEPLTTIMPNWYNDIYKYAIREVMFARITLPSIGVPIWVFKPICYSPNRRDIAEAIIKKELNLGRMIYRKNKWPMPTHYKTDYEKSLVTHVCTCQAHKVEYKPEPEQLLDFELDLNTPMIKNNQVETKIVVLKDILPNYAGFPHNNKITPEPKVPIYEFVSFAFSFVYCN